MTEIPAPTGSDKTTQPRKAALAFIFVTVLLDVMAIGLIVPVLPVLIKEFQGGDTARAAYIVGWFGAAWGIAQFLAMPAIGALSDKVGRRPVILISNLGLGFEYFVMALAPDLIWLFVGRLASGVTAASFSTAFAYVADITAPEARARRFGLLGMAFGLGFVIGPAIGGLLGGLDPRAPFWVAGILSMLNALWGVFVLPESLAPENRTAFDWRKTNPLRGMSFLLEKPGLAGLGCVKALNDLAHYVLPATFVLYTAHRYQWTETQTGLSLALVGLSGMAVQGGMVGPVVKRLGERRTLFISMAAGTLGFCGYGLAPTGATFLLAVPVMALWGLGGPSIQALMSREVGPESQGRLQGAVSGLSAAAAIPAPILFTSALAFGVSPAISAGLPGAAFFVAALLVAGSFFVARHATRARHAVIAG